MSFPFSRRNQYGENAKKLEKLRASRREILENLQELHASIPQGSMDGVKKAMHATIRQLERIPQQAKTAFDNLSALREVEAESYRGFKFDHDLNRDARTPNIFSTLMVVQGTILAEGAVTAALLVSDGRLDVAIGGAYGLSIASVNVATGLLCGFLPGRYFGYRLRAVESWPSDWKIRAFARTSFTALCGVMGTLNFAAARVRATGSHEGIFNFDAVSLAVTFNDYFAIAIMTIGLIGGVLAIYKGWTGISDPVPGFSEAKWESTTDIDEAAQDLRDRYLDAAEALFESALDHLEDRVNDIEDTTDIYNELFANANDLIVAHNDNVEAAKEAAQAMEDAARESYRSIKKRKPPGTQLDLCTFDALEIPEPVREFVDPVEDCDASELRASLQSTYDRVTADIDEAFIVYSTHVSDFDLDQ